MVERQIVIEYYLVNLSHLALNLNVIFMKYFKIKMVLLIIVVDRLGNKIYLMMD